MKIQTLFLAGCATLLFACNKRSNNTTTTTPLPIEDPKAVKFTVNGIADKNMKWTDSAVLPLSIVHIGGNQEKISLSAEGVPANMTLTFDPASGIPAFASVLSLRNNNVAGGTYNIKVKATPAKGEAKTYDMTLTVQGAPPPCGDAKVGSYATTYSTGGTPYTTTVSNPGKGNTIVFANLVEIYSNSFYGDLDCEKKTIKIQPKVASYGSYTYEVSGNGTFTDNTMDIHLEERQPGGTYVYGDYYLHLERQ